MADRPGARSAASRVFAIAAATAVVVGLVVAALLVWEAQRSGQAEAERVTRAVAETIAEQPSVAAAVRSPDPSAVLQPFVEDVMAESRVDFVTIMTLDGIRLTHRDRDEIGHPYIGTIPDGAGVLTEQYTGTLGPSIRTIVPVMDGDRVVARVSVGVTVATLGATLASRLPVALAVAGVIVAAGFAGAFVARRLTRRVTGDLPAGSIRDAVSSYESVRTLGEALRAQTHEHGNRMHTAVALMELGRADEAIEILTETARQSQELVDQVAARRDGDPTVGALLLGKSSQAKERGIRWTARIDPSAPRSTLSPVDAVSVVGNLIDNALDAAASGPEPRWVEVALSPTTGGDLAIEVRDSGDGVPDALRDRVFEHGFSTKPGGADGRGVGLALVRAVVDDARGRVEVEGSPTTFRVTLPARTRP